MYRQFGLTLMVNHACNLRCTYCYTGDKFLRRMNWQIAKHAIDRAVNSLDSDGTLELAFFGGEPLIEADLIAQAIKYADTATAAAGKALVCQMTTNGTINHAAAWNVIAHPRMRVAISHDGLSAVHDRHRVTIEGTESAATVEKTIRRLVIEEIPFSTVSVVRPDTVESLPHGLDYLYELGVRNFEPLLDLWMTWTRPDLQRLATAVAACADRWSNWLPKVAVSWFDSRAAQLCEVPAAETSRCAFGAGEVAVAPSGNLYPCERLIGEDRDDNRMRLQGHALDGDDFLTFSPFPAKHADECNSCALLKVCSTTCRCSNYIRTGDATTPDGLLCWFDQTCFRETKRVLVSRSATFEKENFDGILELTAG